MDRARASQGDTDPSGKTGGWDIARVAINIAAVTAATIMFLVWMFFWAKTETALAVVFVAALLMFIIPIVIFAKSLEGDGHEHGGHGG